MDIELTPDDEGQEYEPIPLVMNDGDVMIPDPVEFCELYDAIAVQVQAGGVYVLERESRKWVNVEGIGKSGKSGLKRVQ